MSTHFNSMNTQSANQIELRIRTMRTLWIGMILSVGAYYVFTLVAGRSDDITPNPTLSLILTGVALSMTLISFAVKNRLLSRAVDQQQVQLVQQGYIVTWALSEVAALLGLLDFFVTGDRYYYLLFLIAAGSLLLHFPRREHVMNASFKSGSFTV